MSRATLGMIVFAGLCSIASAADTKPIPRKDAFFGLHFDLHPGKGDTSLGAGLTPENIEALLNRVHPDYVQYDCKGHAGYTGYPTKVGWPSPGIVKDSLKIWREVTRQHGVGLYIHYSGVWDSVAVEHHPEWAVVNADGKPDPNANSVFGPYVEELLIPQLKEVTAAYQLDGVWADGECWATKVDYSPAALAAWQKETGRTAAPKGPGQPHWQEWKMFHRRAFEAYLCRWIDALHEANPALQITSNWMYTTMAPWPVKAKVDFISGDYSPGDSVDRARTEARYIASTGMPWDLMAWGFNKAADQSWSLKTSVGLQQEAAVVLMQGGGFQVYNTPTRDGQIIPAMIDQLGSVADFCRARQAVSHKSTSVPQVALLLSNATQMERSDAVFSSGGMLADVDGALHALLESHYSVDILAEHQLAPRLKDYPLVVIPDAHALPDDFRDSLLAYVRGGGRLLLLGERCARLFQAELGVTFEGNPAATGAELAAPAGPVNVTGNWQVVKPTTAKVLATRHTDRDIRRNAAPAATVNEVGRGRIAAVYGPLPTVFGKTHHPALRRFIGGLVAELFAKPAVSLDGPPCVDVALRRTPEGKLSVHLLNRANAQTAGQYSAIDFIPAVGPFTVKLACPAKPTSVRWVPGEPKLEWSWAQGTLTVNIPRLEIHGVLVVE